MRRLEFETFSVHRVDQFRCLLLHLDHEAFDPAAEMAEENHRWNGDHQTEARVVQCHGNPVGDCEPKISIMPTTVPNKPISGLIVAIVPSVVKKRSSSCATALPASSIASFITSRELL